MLPLHCLPKPLRQLLLREQQRVPVPGATDACNPQPADDRSRSFPIFFQFTIRRQPLAWKALFFGLVDRRGEEVTQAIRLSSYGRVSDSRRRGIRVQVTDQQRPPHHQPRTGVHHLPRTCSKNAFIYAYQISYTSTKMWIHIRAKRKETQKAKEGVHL